MKIKGYDRTTYSTSESAPLKGEISGKISIVIRMFLNVLFRGKSILMPDDPTSGLSTHVPSNQKKSVVRDPNDAFFPGQDGTSDELTDD